MNKKYDFKPLEDLLNTEISLAQLSEEIDGIAYDLAAYYNVGRKRLWQKS